MSERIRVRSVRALRVVLLVLAVAFGVLVTAGSAFASGWSPVVVDNSYNSAAVSCVSGSFCVSVAGSDAVSYNGSSWSSTVGIDPSGGSLESVSCPTQSFCAAADDLGNVLTYNGSGWSSPTEIDPHGATVSVSCA
ncbi:MAG: hypothetical protein M0T77_10560 [Actinomycetota bacterium]|nr:hypothetical protein [Actinomycetota bacterium]